MCVCSNGDERGDDKSREGGGDDDEETQRREGGQQGPWNKGKQSGKSGTSCCNRV